MYKFLFAAFLATPSYGFICDLGSCKDQCTSPDSVIGEQPLPSVPDINNGRYVDCMYACVDIKGQFQCSDGSNVPWLEGKGDNLHAGHLATVPVYQKGTFRAYVEPGFTPLDRELIKEALEIAVEQIGVLYLNDPLNSTFGKCTAALSHEPYMMADFWGANFWDVNTYGHANLWRTPRKPYLATIPDFRNIKYDLRIVKLWDDKALGKAMVGDASVVRPIIALNWNNLKGYRSYGTTKVKDVYFAQPAFWASTIVHEILHTAGHTHQSEINWADPADVSKYYNTFMVYYADCLEKTMLQTDYDKDSRLFLAQ